MSDFDLNAAIQLTAGTIDRRAALFRNLVIGVVGLTLVLVLWALIQVTWIPLTGILGIIPLCVVFLCLDIRKIDRWQVRILAAWQQDALNIDLLGQTMASLRSLPPGTLKAMLATLPIRAVSASGRPPSDDVKSIVSLMLKTNSQCQFYRTAAIGMAACFVLTAFAAALILWRWYPFVLFFPSLFCLLLYRWLYRFKRNRLKKKMADVQNGLDREDLSEIIDKLDLSLIGE